MVTNKDLKFLNVARSISKLSDFKQTKLGCCIVYKGNILSVGANGEKTSPFQKKFNVYRNFENTDSVIDKIHAEISALSKLPYFVYENKFDLRKATLYVYREHKNTHTYACALPCAACNAAILESGIGRVVSTIEDGIKEIKLG